MDIQKAALIIAIILIVVIIFNLGIYSLAKKRGAEINLFTRVYRRAREPWKDENQKLKELSEQVAQFKNQTPNIKDDSD